MASTSASGIGSAARTRGSAASLALAAALPMLLGASPPGSGGRVELSVQNLRSPRGVVRVCLTQNPAHFPDCDGDPAARHLSLPADRAGRIAFSDLPSGSYAVALFHDENGNGRLDTFAGIPREGVGFSRNPRLIFGPPAFDAARFPVAATPADEAVKLHYFL